MALASGCLPANEGFLTIATDLPPDECRALEAVFAGQGQRRLQWITVPNGSDPASLASSADLIVRSSPITMGSESDPLTWQPWRRSDLGLIVDSETLESRAMTLPRSVEDLPEAPLAGLIALDDPRRDGTSLALMQHVLASRPWAEGYALLVHIAANTGAIGRGSSAPARLARGEVAVAPGVVTMPPAAFVRLGPGPVAEAGVVPGSSHEDQTRRLLDVLKTTEGPDQPPRSVALLADLLGATLVEAHDELLAASAALSGRDGPQLDRLRSLLVEAPPWPPASIQELRRDDPSGALVDALAEQVAPGLEARYWLLQDWEAPPQPLDATKLEAIATAADGRLLREPRFRAWLRADWTAWARQRYRRVARQAEALTASRGSQP